LPDGRSTTEAALEADATGVLPGGSDGGGGSAQPREQSQSSDRGRRSDGSDRAADREVKRLAAGGGLNILGGVVNQACLFGLTIVLARSLGSTDVGTYSQAFAMRQLLMLVALGGMRSAMTRYVAIHRADDDPAALRGTIRFGLLFTVGTSTALAVLLFAASHWLAYDAFDNPGLEEALRWVAIGLPSAAFTVAALSATQGFRTQRPHALVGLVAEPVLRFVLTVAVLLAGYGLMGSLVVLQVASIVASVWALVWLRRLAASHPRVTPRYEVRVIMRFAGVSWLSSVAQQGLVWADIVILGLFVSPAEVGVYQVATRLVLVAGIAVQALNASLAPRAADLFQRRMLDTLARLYVASSEWLVRLTLPLLAVLLVCTEPLLRMFGPEFVSGVTVTRLLLVGALIDAATTQGGIVLNMSGRNAMNMANTVAVLIINVVLNILLIPSLGIDGASLAWAIALLVIGVLRAIQVHHFVIPAYPLSWRVLKSFGAAGTAILVGWPLLVALPSTWGFLVVMPLMVAVYLGVLLWLGVEPDDRLVVADVLDRLRLVRPQARSA
jgi:O-antigen/teichoic acid export membrane protein